MSRIYPDLSNDEFDVKYARRKIFGSDLSRFNAKTITTQRVVEQEVIDHATDDGGGGATTGDVPPETQPPKIKCCTRLVLVDRFRVGNETAPMEEGDTLYTNSALKYGNFVVYADGIELTQENNPAIRNIQKAFDSDTVIFNGGVFTKEVIEIYKIFEPIMDGLIDYFIVGAPGAPMVDTDTLYVNAALSGYNFLMFADKIVIHQMDDLSDQRYCSKPKSGAGSDTITVNGGVSTGELIEIYQVF